MRGLHDRRGLCNRRDFLIQQGMIKLPLFIGFRVAVRDKIQKEKQVFQTCFRLRAGEIFAVMGRMVA